MLNFCQHIGDRIPPATKADEERLKKTLDKIFPKVSNMSRTDAINRAIYKAMGNATLTTAAIAQALHRSHPDIVQVAIVKCDNGNLTYSVKFHDRTRINFYMEHVTYNLLGWTTDTTVNKGVVITTDFTDNQIDALDRYANNEWSTTGKRVDSFY